jgi:hypothetical protein
VLVLVLVLDADALCRLEGEVVVVGANVVVEVLPLAGAMVNGAENSFGAVKSF